MQLTYFVLVDIGVIFGYSSFWNQRFWKGGEEKDMDKSTNKNTIKSSMLKAGKRTYFFDVKVSQSNNKYLKITESSFEGEGKERKYNSFLLFPDQVADFQKTLSEISNFLGQ